MNISLWDYLTLRTILLLILILPALVLLLFLPFSRMLSKGAKEVLGFFGLFGMIASLVLGIENGYRALDSLLHRSMQKPSVVFDTTTKRMVYYQEPYDFTFVIHAAFLFGVAFLTWQLVFIFSGYKSREKPETIRLNLSKRKRNTEHQ